jgi:Restriction endonuclease S subunits
MSEQSEKLPTHEYQRFLQNLPTDWDRKEIRRLGTVFGGGTPSRDVPSFWRGSIPWVTPGELSGNTTKCLHDTNEHISASGLAGSGANLLPVGSLMVTTRATLGARAINAVPMATNQGFKSIVFKDTADAEFYFHLFDKVQPELMRRASGTTFLEISAAEFSCIEVPSPKSSEKCLIAKVLDTLDIAIHEAEAIIAKLKAVKQGLLHDLLTGGIDANGELRPPQSEAPHLYKQSPLGWIPKEWEEISLGDIARRSGGLLQTGPFGSQLHAHEYTVEGIPVVMPQDMVDGEVSAEQIARITERKASALARHRLKPNDVVFSRRGDLSRCVAIDERQAGWVCGTGCLLARLPASEVNAHWLALVYQQPVTQSQVMGRAVGSTMANLNTSILAAISIARPTVIEQNEIAERIASTSFRIHAEERTLQKLRLEKAGLMDDLLAGRVRVTPLLTTIQGSS